MSKRWSHVFAVSALMLLGLATAAPAANERRQQQQPRRTLGAGVTVTQTRNSLTAAASLTDSAQPRSTPNRRRVSRAEAARLTAQRNNVKLFVRDRIEVLRKLESYRRLRRSSSAD